MRSVYVEKVIDESKFNKTHGLVLFWCAFAILFEGYDLVILGSIIPTITAELGFTSNQAGLLSSITIFGMMLGAFIFGTMSDKMGRKNIIVFCVFLFSAFSFMIGFIESFYLFAIFRFLTGIGLGGVMPNAIALMTEFSPKRFKNTMVTIMFSGYSVGGILAAAVAIILLPILGWESTFFIAGIPLLTIPFMYKTLPETPYILVEKQRNNELKQILSKVNPTFKFQENDTFKTYHSNTDEGSSVAELFKKGRALSTIMLWVAFSMCLLMIFGMNTWLPGLMNAAGYPLHSSILFLLVLNIGAIFGAIGGGWLSDRWKPKKVLLLFFILATISIFLLGFKTNIFLLYLLVAIAGASTVGTQIISNAYTSQYYPSKIRSTGVGWALGIGRLGAIAGPIMGGVLLTLELPTYQNFLAFAIPAAIGALAIFFIKEKKTATEHASIHTNEYIKDLKLE